MCERTVDRSPAGTVRSRFVSLLKGETPPCHLVRRVPGNDGAGEFPHSLFAIDSVVRLEVRQEAGCASHDGVGKARS